MGDQQNTDNNAENNFGVNHDGSGLRDIFDIGAQYSQSFNGVDIGLAARWGTADRNGSSSSKSLCAFYPTGSSSSSGFIQAMTVDASDIGTTCELGDYEAEELVEGSLGSSDGDPTTWAVGGTIGVSGFTFGATYAENNADNDYDIGDQKGYSVGASYDLVGPWTIGATIYMGEQETGPYFEDREYNAYQLGASRSLGSGVSWDIYYVRQETQNNEGGEIEGNLFGTAVNLSF